MRSQHSVFQLDTVDTEAPGTPPTALQGRVLSQIVGPVYQAMGSSVSQLSQVQTPISRSPTPYTLWELQITILVLFAGVCFVTVSHFLLWMLFKAMRLEAQWPRCVSLSRACGSSLSALT